MTDTLLREEVSKLLQERYIQHTGNLAAWSEGEYCGLCSGTGKLSLSAATRVGERPPCPLCNGIGLKPMSHGRLVPTEPDPQERERIREGLQAAIDEIIFIADRLGVFIDTNPHGPRTV